MQNYIPVGFSKKCHGVKGEIKIQIEEKYAEDFFKSSSVFFLLKGKHFPFFIENVREGKETILKLEEVDSKETAMTLTSKEIFLQPHQILNQEEREIEVEDNLEFEKYIGFKIHDESLGEIGTIEAVLEFPQQEMAVITKEDKEILIPLHNNLIEKIEEKKQYIYMNLPDGILDL